jgi:hypothetical protein
MLLVVKDACLLIDLVETGLLEAWCLIGIPTHTTDLVMAEASHPRQQVQIAMLVDKGLLQKHSMEAMLLQEA